MFFLKELYPPFGVRDDDLNMRIEVDYSKMIGKNMLMSKNRKTMLVNREIHNLAEEFDTKILHHNNNIMIHITYVFGKLSKKAVEKKYNTENLRISSEVVCNNIQDEVFDNYPLLKKIEKREMDKRKRFIAMAPDNRPIDKNVSTYFAVRACLEIYRRNRE